MHLFVYGSLVDPQQLDAVLGHRHLGERFAARLAGYARATSDYPYPYLVESACSHVDGIVIMDLPPEDVSAVDAYEEVDEAVYRREHVQVEVFGCGPRSLRLPAEVYVAGPRLRAIDQDQTSAQPAEP
jgi:gamma-glutamylcyclotransferase (GGCT)/AIG2-like uncharacterized protein YtfP